VAAVRVCDGRIVKSDAVFITAGSPRRKACNEVDEFLRGLFSGAISLAILMPLDDATVGRPIR